MGLFFSTFFQKTNKALLVTGIIIFATLIPTIIGGEQSYQLLTSWFYDPQFLGLNAPSSYRIIFNLIWFPIFYLSRIYALFCPLLGMHGILPGKLQPGPGVEQQYIYQMTGVSDEALYAYLYLFIQCVVFLSIADFLKKLAERYLVQSE